MVIGAGAAQRWDRAQGRPDIRRASDWSGPEQAHSSGAIPSAAVGRCGSSAGAMGREGDHEPTLSLGAEGQTKTAATAAALNPGAGTGAAGRTSDKAHALVVEHRWCIGRHHTDRRDALAH